LPASKVDIIISEWMGYGLLFEAMLDSVLWARDRYLTPGGLMVPSHVTLRISPFADSEFVCSHVSFWKSVYGFKMSSMLTNIYDEVLVSPVKPSSLAADSVVFLKLPLHTISVEELTFIKDVEVTLTKDINELDGWIVWFDVFFMPSHTSLIPEDAVPSHMKRQGYVAFTTGPDGPETHWQQCLLPVNHGAKGAVAIKKGEVIEAQIGYRKKEEKSRSLYIEMQWNEGDAGKGSQRWSLQ
jgi:type I protein arginine methyltransferase